jgi:hypothetical protein
VPGLFASDELEAIQDSLKNLAKEAGKDLSREGLNAFFIERKSMNINSLYKLFVVNQSFV